MKGPGRKNHGTKKVLGLVMVVGIITAGTYAFTASNSVQANNAGDGAQPVSGYTVSNLDYNETVAPDTNPATIETVDFRLNGPADRVKVQLSTTAPKDSWYACTVDALDLLVAAPSTAWTCNVSGYLATDVTNFRVLAYEDENSL